MASHWTLDPLGLRIEDNCQSCGLRINCGLRTELRYYGFSTTNARGFEKVESNVIALR